MKQLFAIALIVLNACAPPAEIGSSDFDVETESTAQSLISTNPRNCQMACLVSCGKGCKALEYHVLIADQPLSAGQNICQQCANLPFAVAPCKGTIIQPIQCR